MQLQNCIFEHLLDNYAIEEGEPDVTSLGGNLSSDLTLEQYLFAATDVNGQSPLFVNAGLSDFHVPTNSPAIDIGVAAGAPATDIDGNPRINEPDAGCYENQEVVGTYASTDILRIQVSPNPVADVATVLVENDWSGAVKVEIMDPAQRVLRTWNTEKTGHNWQFALDVKSLSAGTYFTRVRMGGSVYLGQMIKQ